MDVTEGGVVVPSVEDVRALLVKAERERDAAYRRMAKLREEIVGAHPSRLAALTRAAKVALRAYQVAAQRASDASELLDQMPGGPGGTTTEEMREVSGDEFAEMVATEEQGGQAEQGEPKETEGRVREMTREALIAGRRRPAPTPGDLVDWYAAVKTVEFLGS